MKQENKKTFDGFTIILTLIVIVVAISLPLNRGVQSTTETDDVVVETEEVRVDESESQSEEDTRILSSDDEFEVLHEALMQRLEAVEIRVRALESQTTEYDDRLDNILRELEQIRENVEEGNRNE